MPLQAINRFFCVFSLSRPFNSPLLRPFLPESPMALVTCNVSNKKSSIRSAASCISRPEPLLPAHGVASSGEVSWMSDAEEENDLPIPENAVDRDYNTFLNNLLVDGKSYVLEIWMANPQRLIRLQYEREDDDEGNGCGSAIYPRTWSCSNELSDLNKSKCSEQSEGKQDFVDNVSICGGSTLLTDHFGCFKLTASQVTASYRSYVETIRSRAPTFFRNKLIDAICSPFSQSEYENLMVVAGKRSPQVKLKHLRRDSIPYKTGVLGSSYFDYFPDLAKVVEQADYHKGLALMRGFFFWLKNLGHDGAFMPWVPPSLNKL